MCGRYTFSDPKAIAEALKAIGFHDEQVAQLPTRFNVAPSQEMPVVADDYAGGYRLAPMKWGFVPYWEKFEKPKMAPINARSEEAMEKRMFSEAIQRRRCLIPADGFIEWQAGRGGKQPYLIGLKDQAPFFFAGIFEQHDDDTKESFLLFTTSPNPLVGSIHNRMPVIFSPESAREWMEGGNISGERFDALCRAYPAEKMAARPVNRLVNNARIDTPECLAPAPQGSSGGPADLTLEPSD